MKEYLKIILFVLILGTVYSTALTLTDALTAERIARNKEIKTKAGALAALGIPHEAENLETVFEKNVVVKKKDGKSYFVAQNRDVAFEISGSGLWGPISGVLALGKDQQTIRGIAIVHQEETPGLGGRIGDKEFLDRFKKKTFGPSLAITAAGKASSTSEVDGITGATLSCKSFEKILNSEYQKNIAVVAELLKESERRRR